MGKSVGENSVASGDNVASVDNVAMSQTQVASSGNIVKDTLTAHRNEVIEKYNKLTQEKFYNGVSQKDFMVAVMVGVANNKPRSAKEVERVLPQVMGQIYVDNSRVFGSDGLTERLKRQYRNGQYAALI